MAIRRAAVLSLLAMALLSSGAGVVHAEEAAVKIGNFTFDPPVLKVKAGTVVTWTNDDDIPHTIAAADRSFKSKPLDTNEKYFATFSTPGRFTYFCSLHPQMKATIIVEGAASRK